MKKLIIGLAVLGILTWGIAIYVKILEPKTRVEELSLLTGDVIIANIPLELPDNFVSWMPTCSLSGDSRFLLAGWVTPSTDEGQKKLRHVSVLIDLEKLSILVMSTGWVGEKAEKWWIWKNDYPYSCTPGEAKAYMDFLLDTRSA